MQITELFQWKENKDIIIEILEPFLNKKEVKCRLYQAGESRFAYDQCFIIGVASILEKYKSYQS